MRLASLAEVVRGRLLNLPSVAEVDRFVFDAAKVRRGDCYLHFNGDETALQTALKAGAYAVLFTGECPVDDPEIGWVRVKSVDRALLGLLRFLFVEKNAVVYAADSVCGAIARSFIRDPQLFIPADAPSAIERLQHNGPAPVVLLDAASAFIEAAPDALAPAQAPLTVVREGLFETRLQREGQPLTLGVSSLFLPQLAQMIFLADRHHLKLHWHPHFATPGRFEPAALGRGGKTLIFDCAPEETAAAAQSFIKRLAPWARVYAPVSPDARALFSTPFQYAYLNHCDQEALLAALETARPQTPSLF